MLRSLVLLLCTLAAAHADPGREVLVRLAQPATASAGVYATDGRLLRTLWRGEALRAGEHRLAWDLRDDFGRLLPDARYEVRVIAHDVRHVWEGVVGNSSALPPWDRIHRSYGPPTSLASTPDGLVYAVGYNEAQSTVHGFAWTAPQRNRAPLRHVDPFVSMAMLAVDDDRLYWVNGGGLWPWTFVGAFDLASGRRTGFELGQPACLNRRPDGSCYADQSYAGVIGLRTEPGSRATGIAVQTKGAVLAVAWAQEQRVGLFDKHGGQPVGSLQVALQPGATNQLAMTTGDDLWVLGPREATRYRWLSTAQPEVAARIVGLSRPLAIAVDPRDDNIVWIADGGTSQQIKRYDRSGRLLQILGTIGAGASAIDAQRFCFRAGIADEAAALTVAPDGALWMVDSCNTRIVRIGADGGIVDRVMWVPASYVAAVDPGNPTRVFANFREFAVEPGRGLDTPAAWRLVRNWLPALPAALHDERTRNFHWGGFRLVRTLANGRTYAVLEAQRRQQLVELTHDGRLRPVGPLPQAAPGATAPYLYASGDLGDAVVEGGMQRVRRWSLTGFDDAGNPRWSAQPETIAQVPVAAGGPVFRAGTFSGIAPPQFPRTASGKVVFFEPGVVGNEGFHLGAVEPDGRRWSWQASPSGPLDGRGSFQTRAVDGSTHYGGNAVLADGVHIVYGYHGEFHRDPRNGRVGQANQWMHFHENGLFIGQFGLPSTRAASAAAAPGKSGNAFSPTLVRHGGQLYLYHNDESSFGGVHRWRLDGLDSLIELRGAADAGQPIRVQ